MTEVSGSAPGMDLTVQRLRAALLEITLTLGPDAICACEHDSLCGLRDEATEALRIAREALR